MEKTYQFDDSTIMGSADEQSIKDRGYLKRVRLFFGHGVGNIVSAFVGALLIAIILHDANATLQGIATWFAVTFILAVIVLYIERAFKNSTLELDNAAKWVSARMISGSAVGIMYGICPFLFGESLAIHHEMFIFIILSAMISVASTGYSIMPYYYLALNGVTMLPLTLYFLLNPTSIHILLGITAIIWQFVVLTKSWKVSKTSINEIHLNESLRDEVDQHIKDQTKTSAYGNARWSHRSTQPTPVDGPTGYHY